MTIQVNDLTRAMVYCHFAIKADFLMCLNSVAEGSDNVTAAGRVRFYTGDQTKDPFEDGDRKSWMESKEPKPFAEEMENVLTCLKKLILVSEATGFGSPDATIHVVEKEEGETLEQFMERWGKMPFVHTKKVTMQ